MRRGAHHQRLVTRVEEDVKVAHQRVQVVVPGGGDGEGHAEACVRHRHGVDVDLLDAAAAGAHLFVTTQ